MRRAPSIDVSVRSTRNPTASAVSGAGSSATLRRARRTTTVAGPALALAVITGGCGSSQPAPVALPSTTQPWGPSGQATAMASPSAMTAKGQVVAAYRAFLDAANKAIAAPPEQTRTILMNYATGDFLDFQVRQVGVHQSAHEEPWGRAVVHVTRVEISGNDATVHDCQDDANAGLADQRTHQLIPQSRGTTNQNLVANMTRGSDGRWRVAGLRLLQGACRPS